MLSEYETEYDIKMKRETNYEDFNWTKLAQDHAQW
jgi:hypothetical protein